MTIEEYTDKIVAAWPPLTERQIESLQSRLQAGADRLRVQAAAPRRRSA